MKKSKIQLKEEFSGVPFCFRCGSYEVDVKKDGTRICKNKYCKAITKMENNELNISFEVK
ncbi:MAG: hypothetical protein ACFFG0_03295 [Candidatus Thorarchaeota archaeon]